MSPDSILERVLDARRVVWSGDGNTHDIMLTNADSSRLIAALRREEALRATALRLIAACDSNPGHKLPAVEWRDAFVAAMGQELDPLDALSEIMRVLNTGFVDAYKLERVKGLVESAVRKAS